MPSYETLDLVADSYIPLLAIISFIFIIRTMLQSLALGTLQLFSLLALLTLAYGLMAIDNYFRLWSGFNLDYSTHTAVALALTLFLSKSQTTYVKFAWASLIAYALLMLYQQYHTIADILSTAIAVATPALFIQLLLRRSRLMAIDRHQTNNNSKSVDSNING